MKLHTLSPVGLLLLAAGASAGTVVYDLDVDNAKEIADAIRDTVGKQCVDVLSNGQTLNKCSVRLLPTGQLLVEAPQASQEQVASVLKAITARAASPTPRVTLQYWLIFGEPGKPDSSAAGLRPLDAVLRQLERVHGDLGFKIEDSVMLTTLSGTRAKNESGSFEVKEDVRANGANLSAEIELSFTRMPEVPPKTGLLQPFISNLSVSVSIRRGEYLVLGERTFDIADQSGTLFYVVHWPEAQ